MLLTRHQTSQGPRWAADSYLLAELFDLRMLLAMAREDARPFIEHTRTTEPAPGSLLAPLEMTQEVWVLTPPDRLAATARPLLSFKTIGWRVVAAPQPLHIRADSVINTPEPCLTLIINQQREVVGHTLGLDVTARSLGDHPQAKIFDGSCALGPALMLDSANPVSTLPFTLEVTRYNRSIWRGTTAWQVEAADVAEWIAWLYQELSLPHGVFLMINLPIAFPPDFTVQPGDHVRLTAGALTLENSVA